MTNPLTRTEPPTVDEALTKAAKLLEMAEGETDRGLAAAWIDMAQTWTEIANIQNDRD